ncbi:histidine kinase [Olsenella uli]|uniref:sensor histidine kinase n=1 Tax=Olsenella uli TaxID=133926 RepID=UPI0028D7D808|nr:histidine kinase [Olsenella uli]
MRRWLVSHYMGMVHVVLSVTTVALLALLSWGIAQSNIIAAMLAGAGLAVDIVMGGSTLLVPEDLRSQATERTLRVASGTLTYMAAGLSPESCTAVCQLLLPETAAAAIAMTDARATLAFVGDDINGFRAGERLAGPTKEVMESKHMQTFTVFDRNEWMGSGGEDEPTERERLFPVGIIAPLVVADRSVGTLRLYYRHGRDVDRTQLAIARGLAELLSTQLSAYELDRQAELTARAEVKALQAQINPHFLFNTLNTIASLTRTNPDKARNLLREFSVFYRRTLEGSQSLIPLCEELEQTRRYLKIEKARFGEDRIVETEAVEPGCGSVKVPSFIVQPIVENAVRHAMRDEGPLHIDVQVATDGDDVLLAVADDGLGMDEPIARRLLEGSSQDIPKSSNGSGIALRNVAERIERFYGIGSGVEIMSKSGEGTCVTLRLVGVAPRSTITQR